jgi:hypothetical protein
MTDRLAELRERVAAEHGLPHGGALRGGNAAQLRADAEEFREELHYADRGGARPSPTAAFYAYRQRQAAQLARVFGRPEESATASPEGDILGAGRGGIRLPRQPEPESISDQLRRAYGATRGRIDMGDVLG